eukprot:c37484_g1_i1 orf=84-1439(+)
MMQAVDVSSPPGDFLCPISLDLMSEPVILQSGHTYDRKSIKRWFDKGHNTCPITMKKLSDLTLTPNHMLHRLINDWLEGRRREQDKRDDEVLNTLAIALNQQPSLLTNIENLRQISLTLSDSGAVRQKILGYIEAGSLGSALANVLTKPMADEEVCVEIISILVQFRLNVREIEGLKKGGCVRKLFDFLGNSRVETRRNAARLLALLDASWLWMRFNPAMESGVKRLLTDTETVHEALLLLREIVMKASTYASSLLNPPCELMQVAHTERRGGLTGGSSESGVHMQRWIVEKGFVSMIADRLPQMNTECCEMALEIMEKMCSRSSGHGIGADFLAKTISNLSGLLVKHSEKCTLYSLLILLALFKEREEKGRLNVADKGTLNVKSSGMKGHFMVPGLPKQLLLVLQTTHTPAVKKRCAELLKLLNSYALLSQKPDHCNVLTLETISTSFPH